MARFVAANALSGALSNLLWFQLCWFVAVLGREKLIAVLALLLVVRLLQPDWRRELYLMVTCASIGVIVDAVLTHLEFFVFVPDPMMTLPFWLIGLWLAFSGTLNAGLAWLQGRLFLSALLGAVFGPLSYFAGMQLNAVKFEQNLFFTMLILALIWSLLMPLFSYLAWRFKGITHDS